MIVLNLHFILFLYIKEGVGKQIFFGTLSHTEIQIKHSRMYMNTFNSLFQFFLIRRVFS